MIKHYLALSVLSTSLLGLTACGDIDNVGSDNINPTAVISGYDSTDFQVGDSIELSGKASKDEDGSIASYLWSGSALTTSRLADSSTPSATSEQESVELSFPMAGKFQLSLIVTDNEGATNEQLIDFSVAERTDEKLPPVAKITPNVFIDQYIGSSISFDASGSSDEDGEIKTYSWSNGQTGKQATYELNTLGLQTVTLTVTDGDGLKDQASVSFRVINKPGTNRAPEAKISPAEEQQVALGDKVQFSALGSSDLDGDPLSYVWSTGETTPTIEVHFTQEGAQLIELSVSDDKGAKNTASVEVLVEAPCCVEAPIAIISPATTQTIKLGESITLSAADSSGEELQYLWSNKETTESISLSFEEAGTFPITVTVTDKNGASADANVTIKVLESQPSNTLVYYQSSSAATIYAWDKITEEKYTSGWPGDAMLLAPELGGDWYKFDLGVEVAGLIFDGVPDANLDFDANKPCYKGGSWTADCLELLDPDFDNQAPSIVATPAQGYYSDKTTIDVALAISDNKDPAPLAYYTLDGSTPTTASNLYSGPITIDDIEIKGADGKVSVLAIDKKGNSSTKSFSYYLNEEQLDKPDAMQLGAVYSSEATTFRIWSPDSDNVKVSVNGTEHTLSKVSDFDGYSDVYEVVVNGDLHLAEYTFLINGSEVRDPYGKMAKPQSQTNVVLNMALSDLPGGWSATPELKEREDAIIYEVHVRDFTLDSSSGVSVDKQGRYLGMVEAGTTYQQVKTGIDHLKELGVTHIQLLPVYDYGTCDGQKDCFNWGYDPRNYNVPEDAYSQYAGDEYLERVKEFKMMVDEFHKAGFRVIMDVVYNHTYAKEMFQGITGSYYHSFGDMSGCSNSIASEVPMVSRMIQDSLDYWVGEYNIDGFRFDLIGIFLYQEVEKWGRHINGKYPDRNILMYGEPWDGYFWPQRDKDSRYNERLRAHQVHKLVEEHVGIFNGSFREAIKGKNDAPECAWMCNVMEAGKVDGGWGIYDGLRGSPKDPNGANGGDWGRLFTKDPEQSINYISAHDNYGLWDKVYLATAEHVTQVGNGNHQLTSLTPPSDLNYSKRVVNFSMGMVLTSQGIPFIHAGDEFLRTKVSDGDMSNYQSWNHGARGGTHNTYNLPDSWNKIRWNWKVENAPTFKYFKDIIEIRKAHAGLRMNTAQEIEQYLHMDTAVVKSSGGHLITAHSTYPEDSNELFIVFNNSSDAQVTLPAGNWTQIADATGAVNVSGLLGSATAGGTAVSIFKKD